MTLRVTPAEFDAAQEKVPGGVVGAIAHAIDNIRRFHEAQMPEEIWLKEIQPGIWTGERHTPVESVACYVPRGKGAFPSVEILLGQYSAISLGNYVLGPNAALPTGGKAKTASPLSVFDYLKRTSVAYVTEDGYPLVADDAHRLARYEGFDAHARAVSAARTPLLKDRIRP